ncbi:DUF11 domain-containing protein [Candidatus Gracilibacteria bacterium]|nr:DUF11 domain-containing protein [Candidatus Gracilibacteria bacterium]
MNALVPTTVRHRWNLRKVISAGIAVAVVLAMMPIPQDLRNIFADPPGGYEDNDIAVTDFGDLLTPDPSNCEVLMPSLITPTPQPGCTLRDAVALAGSGALSPGANRIVFDTLTAQTITLLGTLQVDDEEQAGIEIAGSIVANDPLITVTALNVLAFVGPSAVCTTGKSEAALIRVTSNNSIISGLKIVGTVGNGIEVTNPTEGVFSGSGVSNVNITNNWIGTSSRTVIDEEESIGTHGICVMAESNDISQIYIYGNIIVNSQLDGVRLEARDGSTTFTRVSGSQIVNNLIGTLQGNDVDPLQGNRGSGVTVRSSYNRLSLGDEDGLPILITKNIILNNGFVIDSQNGDELRRGDGITLLGSSAVLIFSNYIGATLATPFPQHTEFPLPLSTDGSGSGSLALNSDVDGANYLAASNACDGISIRFVDVSEGLINECPDADPNGLLASEDTGRTYYDGSKVGPSFHNKIYQNQIATNHRNGIYIQSIACDSLTVGGEKTNLINTLSNSGGAVPFQSYANTILQNSIFRNDASTAIDTGSGSYGIGIDLEDYATADLNLLDSQGDSYWNNPAITLSDELQCGEDAHPAWQPQQSPQRVNTDYTITENDDIATSQSTADAGFDPDAGANRLFNTPVINTGSTITDIYGTAPEGSIVEVFQVLCPGSGGLGNQTPSDADQMRAQCDIDFWNESNGSGTTMNHELGHGQGARFLGTAYVPYDDDSDYEGEWHIDPSQFVSSTEYPTADSVKPFTGGIVTATATAFNREALCWDDGDPTPCDEQDAFMNTASVADFSNQAMYSSEIGGLWLPGNLPGVNNPEHYSDDVASPTCYDVDIPAPTTISYLSDPWLDMYSLSDSDHYISCLGSTSEFSANALIVSPTYSLQKTLVSASPAAEPGSTLTYLIDLTNTGSVDLPLPAGTLSDILPSQTTLTSCSFQVDAGTVVDCTAPSGSNILGTTTFPTLEPGEVLHITVIVAVDEIILDDMDCTVTNTVGAGLSSEMLNWTQSGTTDDDHEVETALANCPTPSTTQAFTNLEKQISASGSAFANADSPSTIDAFRGDAIAYAIHVANVNSDNRTATGTLSDTFPTSLTGTPTVVCWLNATAIDTDPSNDSGTLVPCGYTAPSFDSDTTVSGIQTFSIAANQHLHVLVTGFTVPELLAYPSTSAICNTATTTSNTIIASDTACMQVLDPGLSVAKSVVIGNGPETSFDTSTGAPTAAANAALTYYIDVQNTSADANLAGLIIDEDLPAGLSGTAVCSFNTQAGGDPEEFDNHTHTYVGTCTINPSTGVISGVDFPTELEERQILHIRITGFTVTSQTLATNICNLVTARSSLAGLSTADSACIRTGQGQLSVEKTVSPTTPAPGATVTYTMTVTNTGTASLTDVSIVDDLNDTLVGNNVIPTCVASISQVTALDDGTVNTSTSAITWNVATLVPNTPVVVRFTAVINPAITTVTTCGNTIVAQNSQVTSNESTATINVGAVSGTGLLTIEKRDLAVDDDHVYEPGDVVRYRVDVDNVGQAATGLTVRDSIPSAEESLSNVVHSTGTLNSTQLAAGELELNGIAVGASASQTITYQARILDEDDFPLRNYRLSAGADREDDDFYIERVRNASLGSSTTHDDADAALDAPDQEFVSLGEDGRVTFTVGRSSTSEKLVVDGDGDDFCVLEIDPSSDTDSANERYTVSVSQTTRNSDFERVGRSNQNSNCFDLEDADLTWARYIRVTDSSTSALGLAPGADVDAVCLLNIGGFVTNTAGLYSGTTLLGTADNTIVVNFTDAFDDAPRARDCRERTVVQASAPMPLSPPPFEPLPMMPFVPVSMPIQLPKTGAEATIPAVSLLMVAGLWFRRRLG